MASILWYAWMSYGFIEAMMVQSPKEFMSSRSPVGE